MFLPMFTPRIPPKRRKRALAMLSIKGSIPALFKPMRLMIASSSGTR